MRSTKRTLIVAIPATLLAAAVALACWTIYSAQRTLTRATSAHQRERELPFTLLSLALASPHPAVFELVAQRASFTSGTFLTPNVYLAGPAGLSIYANDGTLLRTLRTGIELPTSPITAVASARPRGAQDAQILLATAGAGLLILSPAPKPEAITVHQLLPVAAPLRELTALLPTPSGDILLGTRHSGLYTFNGTTLAPFRFTLPHVDSATLEVTALASPDPATLLIGTRNAGVFLSHAGTVQHADTTSGLPDNQVEAIAAAPGKAFVGTPLGVAAFELASPTFRPARTLAPGIFAHALTLAPDANTLMIGTLDQGVQQAKVEGRSHFMLASATLRQDQNTRVDSFLTSSVPDAPLFALSNGNLVRDSPSGWLHSTLAATRPTLADPNISALAFAPDGRLLVGFFDHGLDVLSPETLTPTAHFEDDHLFCINRLALDPVRQTIAAATANGLVLFDREGTPRQTLTRRDGLISDHITDIAFTPTGAALSTPAGITFLSPAGAESLYAFQGLVNNHVYTLAARPGTAQLLAGTLGGVSLLESSTVRRNLTVSNSGLQHNWITALAATPDGTWLAGTYGAGLTRLSATGTFTPMDLPAGTPRDLVINPNALLITPTHTYAGTLGHGMLVFTNSTQRWTVVTTGLPSLNVTAFAARAGQLFIGTENGLVHIAEASL